MVPVASDGWREEGPKQTAKGILLLLYEATWVDVCVCVCVCVCVYFEIKSTWQCRRSSSEPWRKVAKVFFCFFILLPGWVGVLVGG